MAIQCHRETVPASLLGYPLSASSPLSSCFYRLPPLDHSPLNLIQLSYLRMDEPLRKRLPKNVTSLCEKRRRDKVAVRYGSNSIRSLRFLARSGLSISPISRKIGVTFLPVLPAGVNTRAKEPHYGITMKQNEINHRFIRGIAIVIGPFGRL